MAKTPKSAAPALEKKTKVKKAIEKPKPVQKTAAKKVAKAEKKPKVAGISGKYAGIKEKKPKAVVAKPAAPKTDGEAKTKAVRKPRKNASGKAVVKISSLPHGFYEEQLKGYFTQFGDVTNVKVVRSLKTGRSKGVAFVEFSVAEVAEIAAETMNNYLLFKNLMKTEYIPPNQVKPGLFAKKVEVVIKADGTQTLKSAVITASKQEVKRLNAKPTEEQAKKRQKKLEEKLRLKGNFIKSLGVDLNVESIVEGKVDLTAPPKSTKKPKKQNITVKVSTTEAVAPNKVADKKPAAKKNQKPAAAKKEAGKASPADKKKKPPTPKSPTQSSKALEKEAKRAAWKKDHEKKVKAKKAAKAVKSDEPKVPVVAPTPAPAMKAKKHAPVVKPVATAKPAVKPVAVAKQAAPAKKEQKKTPAAADAKPAKPRAAPKVQPEKKGVKAAAAAGKGKKASPVKKTIEKKKPLKLTPKKKSVK